MTSIYVNLIFVKSFNISKKMKSLLEKGFVTVRRYHKGTSNFKEYSLVNSHLLTFPETVKKIYQTMEEFVRKSNFLCGGTLFSIQNKNFLVFFS